ncbi:hypothetical protein [Amphritea sp.]|uniref:hypothetical protein n=1 Tax=Amphritea sp. TaxID=1872502 RepID=UPI003D0F7281
MIHLLHSDRITSRYCRVQYPSVTVKNTRQEGSIFFPDTVEEALQGGGRSSPVLLNGELCEGYYYMVIGRVIEIEGNDQQKLLFSQQRHQLLSEAISNNPELADVLSQYPL